ncbi:MAG: RNA polymerase sigma-70 factor [Prolixibacteraceae bacterium]|jgi:RNA polymerase sigma-70 factor (ECF subfamily)|nr:RNA polymerase sigma-70 factor [Prolixibacteraceae bacterium]
MDKNEQLFSQFLKGNRKSFEILFKRFYAQLCYYAYKYVNDFDEAEDIVQGFFAKMWDSKSSVNINTSVKNYFFRSVRNLCLNQIKHYKVVDQHRKESLRDMVTSENDNVIYDYALVNRINQCIDELPPKRREIFVLSREYDLKYREIAERLNISVKTVETQMGLALKELRVKLGDIKKMIIGLILILKS